MKLKIKKIKPVVKKPFLGIFGKTSVELEVEAQVNKIVGKKIKGAQFCQKKLSPNEIEKLFDEDKLQKNIVELLQNKFGLKPATVYYKIQTLKDQGIIHYDKEKGLSII